MEIDHIEKIIQEKMDKKHQFEKQRDNFNQIINSITNSFVAILKEIEPRISHKFEPKDMIPIMKAHLEYIMDSFHEVEQEELEVIVFIRLIQSSVGQIHINVNSSLCPEIW